MDCIEGWDFGNLTTVVKRRCFFVRLDILLADFIGEIYGHVLLEHRRASYG